VRESKVREVKTRVNQDVFRQIVLVNYSGRFAVSGIDIPDLLKKLDLLVKYLSNPEFLEWHREHACR
jgi:hypothetical protein